MNLIRLSATLELNGATVHSDTFALADGVWLGEHAEARVPFEGAALFVAPRPEAPLAVSVGGGAHPIVLRPGGSLRIELDNGGALTLGVVVQRHLKREELFLGDIRLLALTAAVVVFGMWWDTANRWMTTHPEVIAELEALPALWSRVRFDEPESEAVEPHRIHAPPVSLTVSEPGGSQ